jgi:hypothetical protein
MGVFDVAAVLGRGRQCFQWLLMSPSLDHPAVLPRRRRFRVLVLHLWHLRWLERKWCVVMCARLLVCRLGFVRETIA